MNRKLLIGERISEIRKAAGLSQEDVAGRADISPNYLSRIERGKENPTMDMLFKLSDALEVELRELFEVAHLEGVRALRTTLAGFARSADEASLRRTLKLIRALER